MPASASLVVGADVCSSCRGSRRARSRRSRCLHSRRRTCENLPSFAGSGTPPWFDMHSVTSVMTQTAASHRSCSYDLHSSLSVSPTKIHSAMIRQTAHLRRELGIAAAGHKDVLPGAQLRRNRPQLPPLAIPLEGCGAACAEEPIPELLRPEVFRRLRQQASITHASECCSPKSGHVAAERHAKH